MRIFVVMLVAALSTYPASSMADGKGVVTLKDLSSDEDYSNVYRKADELAKCSRFANLAGLVEKAKIFAMRANTFYLSGKKTEDESLRLIILGAGTAIAKVDGYRDGKSDGFREVIASLGMSEEEKAIALQNWERTNALWMAALAVYKRSNCEGILKDSEAH